MKTFHLLAVGLLATTLAACGGTPIPSKPTVTAVATTSNLNGTTANAKKNDIRNQAKGINTLMGFGRLFKAKAPLSQMLVSAFPQLGKPQLAAAMNKALAPANRLSAQATAGGCSSGSIDAPISRSNDADDDGIPVEVLVTFNNCALNLGETPVPVLNGAIYIKDGNDSNANSSFLVIVDLDVRSGSDLLELGLGFDYTAPSVAGGAHGFNFVVSLAETTGGVRSSSGISFNSTFQPTGGGTDPFGNGTLNFTGTYVETEGSTTYSFTMTGTNLGVTTACPDFNAGSLRIADTDSFFQINYTGCGTGNYTGDITGTF
jgi:hypothetical protein